MLRRRIFKTKGFTLWELLIAAAISTAAIGSLFITFTSCMSLNETNNNLVVAAKDAQSVLEEIKSLSYSAIDSYSPAQLTNLENENIAFSFSQISAKIKEVTVDVSWTYKQRAESFRLSTRVAQ